MSRFARWVPSSAFVILCAALIALARSAADAPATSDTAVIESYTRLATHGQLWLGAYSRFQWHHPGPLYFYLLAPFYALVGGKTTGLNAGAAAIAVASMWVVATVLFRRRPTLAIAVSVMLALLSWRAAEGFGSPWNPHVTLLPTLALVVVAADVLAGRARALPLVAVCASVSAQAHVALVPTALLLGVVAWGRACVGAWLASDAAEWRRALWTTLGVLVVAWALPAYEQFTGAPRGNVTELWRFFAAQTPHGQTLGVAVSAWSDMLTGVLRPDFYVAHGWPFVESPVLWAEWLTIFVLTTIAARTVVLCRRGDDGFTASLGGLVLLASASALWSVTRVEDRLFDHDVYWMVGLGVLALALLLDVVMASALRQVRLVRPATLAACLLLQAVAVWPLVTTLRERVTASFHPPAQALAARALADDLERYMATEHIARPLVEIDQDAWEYVAGAVLDLQKRGRIVSVQEDWVVMFTPTFRITGREDAVVTVAAAGEHARLSARGVRLISAHEPVYAHVEAVTTR